MMVVLASLLNSYSLLPDSIFNEILMIMYDLNYIN